MRVLFAPHYPDIPYQRLLLDGLSPLGIEVRTVPALGVQRPAFEEELHEFNADILHLHWLHPYFARTHPAGALLGATTFLRAVKRAQKAGRKVVWTAHNLVNHEGAYPRLDRYVTRSVVRLADRTLIHGESARERVVALCGEAARDRCRVIPMGHYGTEYEDTIDRAEARRRLDLDDDTFVLTFFGRIRPYKGVYELMQAFAEADLGERSLLLIAGKALGESDRVRLKRRCKKAPRVRLDYGYVEDDRMQEYLHAADGCVLPYRDILTSSAAILAMHFKTPIIAPRIGCITDLLDDRSAVLYDPGLACGLRDALSRAYRERADLPGLGLAGRDRVRQWPWSLAAEKTAAVYRELVGGAMEPAGTDP